MSPNGLTTKLTLPNGKSYEQPIGLFINNEFHKPISNTETIEVRDPSTDKVITSVLAADEEDIDKAVFAARAAFESETWSELAATARGDIIRKLSDLIYRDRELLAAIDAWDNGKTYEVALTVDMDESYNVFKYYAGFADKIVGKTIETEPAKFAYTLHEPLGVCGQIIPWNYPLAMLAWKVAPAIACGNTVVLKSAEQTPLSALYLGNLIIEAGFPRGVINIVSGLGKIAGHALASHLGVDKIAFTGSTATGRSIMKAASANLKNITLECGGKSPSIVFADANLEQAVKWTHAGIMDNQGQVCTSTSRIYVEETIYETFVEAFTKHTRESTEIGSPFKEGVTQGPQVTRTQLEKIMSYIDSGKSEGAKLVLGGTKPQDVMAPAAADGYYVEPTVFVDVGENMKIMKEEIFGPVVAISSFKDVKEVIAKANDTSYGLAAALFTENITKAHAVAKKLQAGMVWINSSNDSHYGVPFGGYKSSGIGRELGPYALEAYTQVKAVHVNLGNRL